MFIGMRKFLWYVSGDEMRDYLVLWDIYFKPKLGFGFS